MSPYLDSVSDFFSQNSKRAKYIKNQYLMKSINSKTLHEIWTAQVPNIRHLQDFGCEVFCIDGKLSK